MKLTPQENSIINYLSKKSEARWEELAQFAKDPQTVKLRTLQKVISDLKKKYSDAGEVCPIANTELMPLEKLKDKSTVVTPMMVPMSEVYKELGDPSTWEEDSVEYEKKFVTRPMNILEFKRESQSTQVQNLVRVKPTAKVQAVKPVEQEKTVPEELPVHRDFKLDKTYRRVKTKNGNHELREQEWEIFVYLYNNAEKMVTLEDLKNLIWKNWGSKTPPSWADSISRSLTGLRKTIPELKLQGRLLTITGQTTSYMLR